MKNLITGCFLILTLLSSCVNFEGNAVQGSGELKNETRTVENFTAISVSRGITAELTMGDTESIEIETDDNIMELITTEVKNGTLVIRSTENFRSHNGVTVRVTAKEINAVDVSSGADIRTMNLLVSETLDVNASSGAEAMLKIETKELDADVSSGSDAFIEGTVGNVDADVSSGSNIRITGIESDEVVIDVSSGSDAYLAGTTGNLDAQSSSAGNIKAIDLTTSTAKFNASSASDISATIEKELNANASSSSSIQYKGNPSITVREICKSCSLEKL